MNRGLFETLTFDKKKEVVFTYGEFITKFKRRDLEFRLYRVYTFLVEIQMNKTSKIVEVIHTIDEDKALDKFSEGIDLRRLLRD